jgi:hypothetical protein
LVTVASRRKQRQYLTSLIDKIFAVDPRIRFVAIYQDQYVLAGGMRKGLTSLDPELESQDIDLQLAKIGEITRSWQRWFGTLDALALRYEKLNLVFQPLREGRFLVLSAEVELNPFELLGKLRNQEYGNLAEIIP